MDVNFQREVDPFDPDALLQQMVEYRNGLMTEYNKEQKEIIVKMRNKLQHYLDRNHPGHVVPSDGPHFQFMMSSFEDISFLILETENLHHENILRYEKVAKEVMLKIDDHLTAKENDSLKTLEEFVVFLDRIRDSVGVMTQTRLDSEGQIRALILRHGKMRDLAKRTVEVEGDAFLGILRKGILSILGQDYHERISQMLTSSLDRWSRLKSQEENALKLIDKLMKPLKPCENIEGDREPECGEEEIIPKV